MRFREMAIFFPSKSSLRVGNSQISGKIKWLPLMSLNNSILVYNIKFRECHAIAIHSMNIFFKREIHIIKHLFILQYRKLTEDVIF